MSVTFQPVPEPGCSLFVPGPSITRAPNGNHLYRFDVWLNRPAGRAELLQSVTWTSSLPIRLRSGEGTPALTSVLLPAMALGLPVIIEAPVSPRFMRNIDSFQSIFASWFPTYRKIDITAPLTADPPAIGITGTAAFFSGGVDGFYTLRHHLNEVSTLVMMHGFDLDLDRIHHRTVVDDYMGRIASELRRDLAVLQTTIRTFSDRYAWWGEMCGSTLGAAAQLLEGVAGRMLVASGSTYADFVPFGTTVLTDPLLSTEGMNIVVDGGAVPRIDKVFELARWDYARERLRVCWRMQNATLNCCRCNKCLRTMTSLWLAGALDRAPTFGTSLSPEQITGEPLKPIHASYVYENLQRARELGVDGHPIMQAWQRMLMQEAIADIPADQAALARELDGDPLVSMWLADHAGELISETGRRNPGALLAALRRHAPEILDEFIHRYRWKAPAALAGQTARRLLGNVHK
jgi:hypothetical protein